MATPRSGFRSFLPDTDVLSPEEEAYNLFVRYQSTGGTMTQPEWEAAGRPTEDPGEDDSPFPRLDESPEFGSMDNLFEQLIRNLGINLSSFAMEHGLDPESAFGEFASIYNSPGFSSWLETRVWSQYDSIKNESWAQTMTDQELFDRYGPGYYQTIEGQQILARDAWDYVGSRTRMSLGDYPGAREVSRRSGGGGGGRRTLTPDDIRNQYDIDQLSEMVNGIWRNMLIQDNPDARSIAKAYVDTVVAGKGEKNIDFETFVRQRARNTSRYKSIFPAKLPDGMSEEQYINQYVAAASTVARPEDVSRIAIQGAQLGSSQEQFGGRLARESRQQGSTPFMQSFGRRLSSMRGVLKG